jgi:hypothetical protein
MSRYSSKQFDEIIRRKNETIKNRDTEIRKLKKDINDYKKIIRRFMNEVPEENKKRT